MQHRYFIPRKKIFFPATLRPGPFSPIAAANRRQAPRPCPLPCRLIRTVIYAFIWVAASRHDRYMLPRL